jgi:type IV secretion system protein VirD4
MASVVAGWIFRLGEWGQAHPWILLWWLGGLMAAALTVKLIVSRGGKGESTTHGSARWATSKEIQKAGLWRSHGVILGHLDGKYLRHDGPEHVLLEGATRRGKGVGVIVPTAVTWQESLMVLDPKDGENYDLSAAWRRAQPWHGPVWAFTPGREPSTRINVLDTIRLRTRREFADALLIAQSLVAPEKMLREHPTSLHFRELAALLLTAAILHVLYTSRRKSLAGVWQFLTQEHDSLAGCLALMSRTRHRSEGVHQAIVSMTRAIKNITGDRELSSVWSTAIRPLVLYNDDLVAQSTDTSDVDLEALQYGEQPVSLYLIAPSPMELERLHPVYRVILDVAFTRLMEHKVRTWRHRLLAVCDELPAYGYTRAIEKGIPVMAGYGIKGLLVVQDLSALWDVYGEHSQIWGNCRVRVFMGADHDLTAKRVSENLLGNRTQEYPMTQRTPVIGHRKGVTEQSHARALLTTDEVMALPDDQEIIQVVGMKPILAYKCDYREDPQLRERVA